MNDTLQHAWSISFRSIFLLLISGISFLGSLSTYAIVDTNDNGLSDLWEKQYNNDELFLESFDPLADPDSDGWNNAAEAAAGTNPFDPNPPDGFIRPQIAHFPAEMDEDEMGPFVAKPEAVEVTWPSVVGKQYHISFSFDLTAESWFPVDNGFIGNGNEVSYSFPVSDDVQRFWQVKVSDADTDGDGLTDVEELEIGSSRYLADTDDDGIDDAVAYAAGMHPAGEGVDTDGDGIPDNEIYSVLFEIQQQGLEMPVGIGHSVLDGTRSNVRYLTRKTVEEFSISGSYRYAAIPNGKHTNTSTFLDGTSITEDGEPLVSDVGSTLASWQQSNWLVLGPGESCDRDPTTESVVGPTISPDEISTTTTKSTSWTVTENGQFKRQGVEQIVVTERTTLSDVVTYPDFWVDHVIHRPWTDSNVPLQFGPLYSIGSGNAAVTAEANRNNFISGNYLISGTISDPSLSYSDFGSDSRLKFIRWRWIRFNLLAPFTYEYAAPPASYRKTFHFLVEQSDQSGNEYPYQPWIETEHTSTKGVVGIECSGNEGSAAWQEVSLAGFNVHQIGAPADLATTTFTKWCNSLVSFGNLPAQIIPEESSIVSADDHSTNIVFKIGSAWTAPFENSTIEWQIETGVGGSLSEAETQAKDGITTVTLTTSTLKGAKYTVKARIKKVGADGNDISGNSPWIVSPEFEVTAGTPSSFAFTTTKSSYRSDGTDTSEITAEIKDQYGNPVEDDTSVSWAVGQNPTSLFDSKEDATVDGIAKALLRAPLIPDDQVVTCSAGDKQASVTVAVEGVTGSLAGNVNLDIGTAQQSTITVSAQAADGTPVYWTSSNGEITAQSIIENGIAIATLGASGGRLGKVVVTATVGDHLFYTEGQFSSTTGLSIGADHPVLIANATADGIHTPVFAHGIARQFPFYASTPIRIKGPPSGLAHLTFEASVAVGSWSFDELIEDITPSENGLHGMTLNQVDIDEEVQHSGTGSLLLDGNGSGSVPDHTEFHFTAQFNTTMWLRPTEITSATFAAKNGSWHIGQLADGRIQANVTTETGTHIATTVHPLILNQWTLLTVDFRFNRLQIKFDNLTTATTNTTGSIVATTNGIEIGAGFHGNLDNLTLRAGDDVSSHVTFAGLDPGNTLQLDMMGEGSFTLTSTGTGAAGTNIHIFSKVNPEAETAVTLVDPGFWDYTCDTVASFVGGDPQTNAGTVSSIAGGFLIVGDIGSCTKNLWRMAGWSDKKPNYIELSLGGLGILTTFAEVTVVGAPADAGVASVKTLAIRFGNNPKAIKFLTVFVEQIKNAVVGRGAFGWAEANFLKKMVTDIPVADAFKLFMHDDGLAPAAIHATEKLGGNAESFYQATRRAVASHGEEAAKKFVQAFEGLSPDALTALKNAPAAQLDKTFDGLAKPANKGITPFSLTRTLNNPHLYGLAYKRTNLLKDLGELSDVPGLESAIKMLKINHRNVKGFRYEIEGAATLKRGGETIFSITEKVSVIWDDIAEIFGSFGKNFGHKTDIDVLTGVYPDLIYRQFKSTAAAMKSPNKVAAWCEKVRKARGNPVGNYEGLKFHLPPDEIPKISKSVKDWLDARNIPIEAISMKQ